MSKTLVIVESPAKCKKIESYLGPGYICIASYGHIQQIVDLKSIDIPNNFQPNFIPIKEKIQQINKIKRAMKDCNDVLLATDDDREGEAIAWHICNVLELPVNTTKRIIFHEVTKPALLKAVQSTTIINMDIVHAQQARQILDLLVGFMVSPLLWKHISRNSKKGLSAGRCQTPALRLVYDNQKEIDKSPGRQVYNTTGYFTTHNLPYVLNFNYEDPSKMETFLENSVDFDHKYQCGKSRKTTKNPPTPFTTSALQQAASNELHISPKDTMSVCQKLYEGGYITYMRTDSKTYSKEFVKTATEFIQNKWGKEYVHEDVERLSERGQEKKKTKKKKTKKEKEGNAQEAHEAIRPTDIKRLTVPEDMHSREKKMYRLIWRNTVESCMSPALYNAITSKISAPEDHEYRYSTELVDFPGWKIVNGYEKENPVFQYLRTIKNKYIIPYKKITCKVSLKELKSHYTEAKLVQLLEQKGIGRPSTFSSLIDKIQNRGYVKKDNVKGKKINCIDYELIENEIEETDNEREFGNERNKLVIQPIGLMVVEFLIKYFNDIFIYEYTKNMEDALDIIAKGNKVWYELCKDCLGEINTLSADLKESGEERQTIKIDDHHTYMVGKYGPVIRYKVGEVTEWKPVKKDIDLRKLEDGEYELSEIFGVSSKGRVLGRFNGEDLILRKGKFGLYATWGEQKKSLNYIKKEENDITLEDVIQYIEKPSIQI